MGKEISDDISRPDNTLASQLLHDSFSDTPKQTALQMLRETSTADRGLSHEMWTAAGPITATPKETKPVATAPKENNPVKPGAVEQQPLITSCGTSQDYRDIMTRFFSNAYDIPSKEQRDKMMTGFNCDIHSKTDILKTANEALKSTGDHYNHMFTPKEWKAAQERTSGHFFGVGMELISAPIGPDKKPLISKTKAEADEISKLDIPDKEPVVFYPLPGTPAAAAGFQKGDVITHVTSANGDVDTRHMPLDEVVDQIRGPINSNVHITVERDGQPIEKDVVRQEITIKTVDEPKQLENGITYIRIKSFGEGTTKELKEAILKFPDSKGFVIDVRNNGGGLVSTSVGATEFFIKKGEIATLRDRVASPPENPKYSDNTYSLTETTVHVPSGWGAWTDQPRLPYLAGDKPIVVLTNGGTASGAEIFTGALHDTAKATVIGEDTFGKGIGQIIGQSQFGSGISVTDLHYLTPSGIWPGDAASTYALDEVPVNRHRLQPDIKVINPDTAEVGTITDLQLNEAIHVVSSKMVKAPSAKP